MKNWEVLYYTTIDNKCVIEEFINRQPAREKFKILNWVEQLQREGPYLPRPYADLLEDGIHELRIKLKGKQVRILYFFYYKDYIVLTHAFIKTTSKVPIKEILKAKKYREKFLKRINKEK